MKRESNQQLNIEMGMQESRVASRLTVPDSAKQEWYAYRVVDQVGQNKILTLQENEKPILYTQKPIKINVVNNKYSMSDFLAISDKYSSQVQYPTQTFKLSVMEDIGWKYNTYIITDRLMEDGDLGSEERVLLYIESADISGKSPDNFITLNTKSLRALAFAKNSYPLITNQTPEPLDEDEYIVKTDLSFIGESMPLINGIDVKGVVKDIDPNVILNISKSGRLIGGDSDYWMTRIKPTNSDTPLVMRDSIKTKGIPLNEYEISVTDKAYSLNPIYKDENLGTITGQYFKVTWKSSHYAGSGNKYGKVTKDMVAYIPTYRLTKSGTTLSYTPTNPGQTEVVSTVTVGGDAYKDPLSFIRIIANPDRTLRAEVKGITNYGEGKYYNAMVEAYVNNNKNLKDANWYSLPNAYRTGGYDEFVQGNGGDDTTIEYLNGVCELIVNGIEQMIDGVIIEPSAKHVGFDNIDRVPSPLLINYDTSGNGVLGSSTQKLDHGDLWEEVSDIKVELAEEVAFIIDAHTGVPVKSVDSSTTPVIFNHKNIIFDLGRLTKKGLVGTKIKYKALTGVDYIEGHAVEELIKEFDNFERGHYVGNFPKELIVNGASVSTSGQSHPEMFGGDISVDGYAEGLIPIKFIPSNVRGYDVERFSIDRDETKVIPYEKLKLARDPNHVGVYNIEKLIGNEDIRLMLHAYLNISQYIKEGFPGATDSNWGGGIKKIFEGKNAQDIGNTLDGLLDNQISLIQSGKAYKFDTMSFTQPFGTIKTTTKQTIKQLRQSIINIKAVISMTSAWIYSGHAWEFGGGSDVHTIQLPYYFDLNDWSLPGSNGVFKKDYKFVIRSDKFTGLDVDTNERVVMDKTYKGEIPLFGVKHAHNILLNVWHTIKGWFGYKKVEEKKDFTVFCVDGGEAFTKDPNTIIQHAPKEWLTQDKFNDWQEKSVLWESIKAFLTHGDRGSIIGAFVDAWWFNAYGAYNKGNIIYDVISDPLVSTDAKNFILSQVVPVGRVKGKYDAVTILSKEIETDVRQKLQNLAQRPLEISLSEIIKGDSMLVVRDGGSKRTSGSVNLLEVIGNCFVGGVDTLKELHADTSKDVKFSLTFRSAYTRKVSKAIYEVSIDSINVKITKTSNTDLIIPKPKLKMKLIDRSLELRKHIIVFDREDEKTSEAKIGSITGLMPDDIIPKHFFWIPFSGENTLEVLTDQQSPIIMKSGRDFRDSGNTVSINYSNRGGRLTRITRLSIFHAYSGDIEIRHVTNKGREILMNRVMDVVKLKSNIEVGDRYDETIGKTTFTF